MRFCRCFKHGRAVLVGIFVLMPIVTRAQPAAQATIDVDAVSHLVMRRTNAFRGEQRLPATDPEPHLAAAARAFAGYMARTDRYGHDADGRTPAQRAEASGYAYCALAENIAFLASSTDLATEAMARTLTEGWKNSPEHRRNMLRPEVVDSAVAIAQSPTSQRYYAVQLFGRPRSKAIDFSVANASGRPLRYRLGDKSFDLPARATRTHTTCEAGALSVESAASAPRIEPASGRRYVLEAGADGVRVREE